MGATFDISRLELAMRDLVVSAKQDAVEVVRSESARLAEECATQLSRRGRQGGEHTIKKDVASVFMPEPGNVFEDHRKNGSGITWLYATPFDLVGILPEYDRRNDSIQNMLLDFYPSLNQMPAERRTQIGTIGTSRRNTKYGKKISSQRVLQVQRLLISRANYRAFVALLVSHKGRLEASFADTANKLRGSAKVPAKISRHFPSPKNITRDMTADSSRPFVEFGSRARGVTGFEIFIENAIRVRAIKIKQRVKYLVKGYAASKQRGRITPQAKIITVME